MIIVTTCRTFIMCLTYVLYACVCEREREEGRETEVGGHSTCDNAINNKIYVNDANNVSYRHCIVCGYLQQKERGGMEKGF